MVKFKPLKNIKLTKYDGKEFTPNDEVELTLEEEKEIQEKIDKLYPEHGKAFERVEEAEKPKRTRKTNAKSTDEVEVAEEK